jgi:hypothetical protein
VCTAPGVPLRSCLSGLPTTLLFSRRGCSVWDNTCRKRRVSRLELSSCSSVCRMPSTVRAQKEFACRRISRAKGLKSTFIKSKSQAKRTNIRICPFGTASAPPPLTSGPLLLPSALRALAHCWQSCSSEVCVLVNNKAKRRESRDLDWKLHSSLRRRALLQGRPVSSPAPGRPGGGPASHARSRRPTT